MFEPLFTKNNNMNKKIDELEEGMEVTFPFELNPDNIKIQGFKAKDESDKYTITITINGPFTREQKEMLDGLMNGINDELLRPVGKESLSN